MAVQPRKDTPPGSNRQRKSALEADAQAESTRLQRRLLPTVERNGLVLEGIEIRIAGAHRTVNVIVDLPETRHGGVGLETISEVSHEISVLMDSDPADDGRPYSLEVSSPGVSRPLTEPRHFRRNIGRMVSLKLSQGDDITGRVLAVDEKGITIRPQQPVKKGMKPKHGEPHHLAFGSIRKGTVQVEFAHQDDDGDAGENAAANNQPA